MHGDQVLTHQVHTPGSSVGGPLTVSSTIARKRFGSILDAAARGETIVITRRNSVPAVLISAERYSALVAAAAPDLDLLTERFDRFLAEMQQPGAVEARHAGFLATPGGALTGDATGDHELSPAEGAIMAGDDPEASPPHARQPAVVWGTCFFHSETGTEGGYWAVQDIKGVRDPASGGGAWTYFGMVPLESGDELTIYTPESVMRRRGGKAGFTMDWSGEVVWQGKIQLREYPPFQEDAFGYWIHSDQEGIDREVWARWFMEGYPCRLLTSREPWVVGTYRLPKEDLDVIGWQVPRLLLYSDGNVGWDAPEDDVEFPPFALCKYLEAREQAEHRPSDGYIAP